MILILIRMMKARLTVNYSFLSLKNALCSVVFKVNYVSALINLFLFIFSLFFKIHCHCFKKNVFELIKIKFSLSLREGHRRAIGTTEQCWSSTLPSSAVNDVLSEVLNDFCNHSSAKTKDWENERMLFFFEQEVLHINWQTPRLSHTLDCLTFLPVSLNSLKQTVWLSLYIFII